MDAQATSLLALSLLLAVAIAGCDAADPTDTTAPSVALTAPAPGVTLSGTIEVRCSATDDGTLAEFSLWVDGEQETSTFGPCMFNWNTGGISDGAHTLLVRATDASGNVGQSPPITITTDNEPDQVFVTRICLDDVDYTNASGTPWDLGSNPDFYWELAMETGGVAFRTSTEDDAPPASLPLCWEVVPEHELSDWDERFLLRIWDEDIGSDELIASTVTFSVNDLVGTGYSTLLFFSASNGLEAYLRFRWE